MKRLFLLLIAAFLIQTASAQSSEIGTSPNQNWQFKKLADNEKDANYHLNSFDASNWKTVSLPHTANIEPLLVNNQWQGICWYRQSVFASEKLQNKKIFLEWEGAMHVAQVYINGALVTTHLGGYLPIVIDATPFLEYGKDNVIAIRLDNQDNPLTGPKPVKILDFNMYGGLYRKHNVVIKDKLYISNPNLARKVAGGGLFITTPEVGKEKAIVNVKAHVVNEEATNPNAKIKHTILYNGKLVATTESILKLKKKRKKALLTRDFLVNSTLTVENPQLWHPQHPHLYQLKTEVLVDGKVVDTQTDKFGIRHFEFKGLDLYINGEKTFLRGVNRHQEYPFIGYALSDNAQYRDAKKIKDAGFDYIRLSHYPHSPAFMDACDELGLVVTDAILGWQFYTDDDRFNEFCYNSTRQLIRRDRNHACVLLWEASLNETQMPEYFMDMLNMIVHQEFPGENTYTAGWKDYAYDVYFQARQHKIKHNDYDHKHTKPYAVSEYGDWEYYSSNAGLNQDGLDKTIRFETSSRQRRGFGEARLLNQLNNIHESHNDNFTTAAFADSYWVMYDYNRGYHPDIEFSGVSDIFRIEKWAYYFYKSQREPTEEVVLNIATFWTKKSPIDVKVLSNCDEVALYLNGKLIAKQKPDTDKNSTHIPHPPFTFKIPTYQAGTLKAIGFINGKQVSEAIVKSPKKAKKLKVWIDESGKKAQTGVNDVLFIYVAAVDGEGTVIPDFSEKIDLNINGDFELMNVGEMEAEAGIATALIRIGTKEGTCKITAKSKGLSGSLKFEPVK